MLKKKLFLGLITRCKDEYFIAEFVSYYLSEGVDLIYIIDDNSSNKEFYKSLHGNHRVIIVYEKNIINSNYASKLYAEIKNNFEWLIYVDVDEFITTKKDRLKSIRDELKTNFHDVDCIKIPWVMMSSNNQGESPASVLRANVWRWNHDLEHPNRIHKFRCRYQKIEVKCIFRTSVFEDVTDHHPKKSNRESPKVVESVSKKSVTLDPFHNSLREVDIKSAYLVCYHYRIISAENNKRKLDNNQWYIDKKYSLKDLESSDHSEVFDNTMSIKSSKTKIFVIGFNRCGTRTLHYFFKKNGLRCIHWDGDNLVNVMERNMAAGNKLLYGGRTVNVSVNSDCRYESAQVFSDLTCHYLDKDAKDYYKILDGDYKSSKFILNIRNIEDWISSRKKHSNGAVLQTLKAYHNCSTEDLENIWRDMWRQSIDEITEYFSDRPNDLLIFNIDTDGVEKITSFLEVEYTLDARHYEYVA